MKIPGSSCQAFGVGGAREPGHGAIGMTAHLFSERKLATYLLDAGYQLVYMVVMGVILASWG